MHVCLEVDHHSQWCSHVSMFSCVFVSAFCLGFQEIIRQVSTVLVHKRNIWFWLLVPLIKFWLEKYYFFEKMRLLISKIINIFFILLINWLTITKPFISTSTNYDRCKTNKNLFKFNNNKLFNTGSLITTNNMYIERRNIRKDEIMKLVLFSYHKSN